MAVAFALSLLGVVTACQPDGSGREGRVESAREAPDDAGGEGRDSGVQAVDYESWRPSYREVRPATADDVRALRQRVVDLNETSYTVAVPAMGLEVASSPDHVRVRFGDGSPDAFDLHLDLTVTTGELFGPFVVCSADDGSCVEVSRDGAEGSGPHLFNNVIDSFVFASTTIVGGQSALPDELDRLALGDASIAVVDSPTGSLDCLVFGGTPEQRAQLEGSPVDLMADPVSREGDPEPLATMCVDDHGLLVVALPSLLAGVVPYGSFEPGVPDGFDDHAAPVPHGTTATPRATTTTTPTSQAEPGQLQHVLVATGTIEVGESLGDALSAGKISLDLVSAESVMPGALSSPAGLQGDVALVEVSAGQQLTEATFGSPSPEN